MNTPNIIEGEEVMKRSDCQGYCTNRNLLNVAKLVALDGNSENFRVDGRLLFEDIVSDNSYYPI